jgi:hypothetical protein
MGTGISAGTDKTFFQPTERLGAALKEWAEAALTAATVEDLFR